MTLSKGRGDWGKSTTQRKKECFRWREVERSDEDLIEGSSVSSG